MRRRNETPLQSVLSVDSVIGVYYASIKTVGPPAEPYDFYQLIYIDGGEYAFSFGEERYSLQNGQLILCPPNRCRENGESNRAQVGIISFRCASSALGDLAGYVFTPTEKQRAVLSELFSEGRHIFRTIENKGEIFGQWPAPDISSVELSLFKSKLELLLISLCHREDGKGEALLPNNRENYREYLYERLCSYLAERLSSTLSVEEIAAYMGLSKSSLKRLCYEKTGGGVMQLFLSMKTEEAKRLLRDTDLNVTEIAERLSFSGVHYFSRFFKKQTGLSPLAYARSGIKL